MLLSAFAHCKHGAFAPFFYDLLLNSGLLFTDKWCNFYTGITGVNPRYFLTLDSRQVGLGFLIKYLCLLCLQVSDEQNQQRFSRQVGCADLLEKNKTKLSLFVSTA